MKVLDRFAFSWRTFGVVCVVFLLVNYPCWSEAQESAEPESTEGETTEAEAAETEATETESTAPEGDGSEQVEQEPEAETPEPDPPEQTQAPQPEQESQPQESPEETASDETTDEQMAEAEQAQDEMMEEGEEEEESDESEENWPCLGRPGARVVYHQLLAAQYNPLGVEHSGRVGVCAPFVRDRGILFDFSGIEFGVVHYLSPSYFEGGGYFEFSPLSILSFRAEVVGLAVYKFPLDRAGYFPVNDYYNSENDEFPSDEAGYAGGWRVGLSATLQAAVPIGERFAILLVDSFRYNFWNIGDDSYYLNLKEDMILARSDQVLQNEGILLLEVNLRSDLKLRVGAFDIFRWAPEPDHRMNLVGGMALLTWAELGRNKRLINLTPLLRLGAYTHHPSEDQAFYAALGVAFNFDLLAITRESSDD